MKRVYKATLVEIMYTEISSQGENVADCDDSTINRDDTWGTYNMGKEKIVCFPIKGSEEE